MTTSAWGDFPWGAIPWGVIEYDYYRDSLSRTPVSLVVLTLDYCGHTFGEAPCAATGAPCYNTYRTCKDKDHYSRGTKEYKFTSTNTPLPFSEGERPYVLAIKPLATEIKDSLTVNARVTVEFADEEDGDIGVDPYVDERSGVQGTFWKKLLARNPHYKGRPLEIYEGFLGMAEGNFQQRYYMKIDTITLGKGKVSVEAVDLLKDLSKIYVPAKVDLKLVAAIDADDTALTVSDASDLDETGYVRIGDEIMYYGAKNDTTGVLSSLTRGAFGTEADSHDENDKVQPCRYYDWDNPLDILNTEMLQADAEIDTEYIDTDAFDDAKDWPGGEIDISAMISEPTKLSELYFELIDLLDCKTWVAEDLKITIARNTPNRGDRAYTALTDEANNVHASGAADLNPDSRISRVVVYWDRRSVIEDVDDETNYKRIDIAVDAESEGENAYGEEAEKILYCRWMRTGEHSEEEMTGFIGDLAARRVINQREAHPIVKVAVEIKDSEIRTGGYVRLTTDELEDREGNPVTLGRYQVVKREEQKGVITLSLMELPKRKIFIIAPDDAPDYDDADEDDREYGYITADSGDMPDETDGYDIY